MTLALLAGAYVRTDLAGFTKDMQQARVAYTAQDGSKGEALIKYFGQSSFSSRMIVTDRSVSTVAVSGLFSTVRLDAHLDFDFSHAAD